MLYIIILLSLAVIGYWIQTAKLLNRITKLESEISFQKSLLNKAKERIDESLVYLGENIKEEDSRKEQIDELGRQLEELQKEIERQEALARHNLPPIKPSDS